MATQLMIVPSLACPARCAYCFGPHEGDGSMSNVIIESIVRWQHPFDGALEITFHGGEPLTAGTGFYSKTLPMLKDGLAHRRPRFSMQSNLWLLDEELCDLFKEYGLSIGTSLDGPEGINDVQRGKGYFKRTMAGIELARSRGLSVGCICTFTPRSLQHLEEIFGFFIGEGLHFTIHAALPSLRRQESTGWSLSPAEHGKLLTDALGLYLANMEKVRIGTLDSMCRSVSAGQGGICTFGDCLGAYLAVGPDGSIYPCQRFAGMPAYSMGNVNDSPSQEEISGTAPWRLLEDRQGRIGEKCGDCAHFNQCRGGCPYNALAAGQSFEGSLKDPHCEAYREVFRTITDRALEEVFSEENLQDVVAQPGEGLLRRGRLLNIMRGGPHPRLVWQQARQILLAAALGTGEPRDTTARKLVQAGLASSEQAALLELDSMDHRLHTRGGLNNLYLHVTFGCNLNCSHCYAQAGPQRLSGEVLPASQVVSLCQEAAGLGFRQVVITGGEPLLHPEIENLLDALSALKKEVKPLLIVLRTNLAIPLLPEYLSRIGQSADKIFVSIDGDCGCHDARRGQGTYELVVNNLRALVSTGCEAELALAAVLSASEAAGPEGQSVRDLANEIGIRRVSIRPLKPLGRAHQKGPGLVRQVQLTNLRPDEMIAYGFNPAASCGIGYNLSVEPSGDAYPCYAQSGGSWLLGSVAKGLVPLVKSPAFQGLSEHDVDTNRQCRSCALRYLCGGACRAWSGPLDTDLDSPPVDCGPLLARARSLLNSALEFLGIHGEAWERAKLPLTEAHGGGKEKTAL